MNKCIRGAATSMLALTLILTTAACGQSEPEPADTATEAAAQGTSGSSAGSQPSQDKVGEDSSDARAELHGTILELISTAREEALAYASANPEPLGVTYGSDPEMLAGLLPLFPRTDAYVHPDAKADPLRHLDSFWSWPAANVQDPSASMAVNINDLDMESDTTARLDAAKVSLTIDGQVLERQEGAAFWAFEKIDGEWKVQYEGP